MPSSLLTDSDSPLHTAQTYSRCIRTFTGEYATLPCPALPLTGLPCHTLPCLGWLAGHDSFLTSLVQLPDGRLVTGSGDKTLKIWDPSAHSSSAAATVTGHAGAVRCIVLLPHGAALASGADDNNVIIW